MHKFRVEIYDSEFPGRQTTANVVRNDGRVVRSSMKPEYAVVDCVLLNELVAGQHSAAWYHAQRKVRMAEVSL